MSMQTLELPGANPLKDAHAALNTAVLTAKKDLLAQLLALNQEVAAKIEKGETVTDLGVPKNYGSHKFAYVRMGCLAGGKNT